MNRVRSRHTETLVYIGIWTTVIAIFALDIMRGRASVGRPLLDWWMVLRIVWTLTPFFILFLVSNYLLIPKLLLVNRYKGYLIATSLCLLLLWTYQYIGFFSHIPEIPVDHIPGMRGGRPHAHPRPLLPLPLFLDFTYGLLVIGANLAVALLFQRFEDRLEQESLRKSNAENALAYLKAQINPHFYMNMLNNIHAMIEIDAEKAQEMVIDMSRLMRYMLYDSSKPLTPLSSEVEFMENYLRLMRLRYPESRVEISTSFPSAEESRGIRVPPLLMLVFIENAFKHGISYREKSYVCVTLMIADGRLDFMISNSRHITEKKDKEKSGIGLINVKRRLDLIFGQMATLDISETETSYTVQLSIPTNNETKNIDN